MSAPERTLWNTPVTVTLWDCLCAIRYGAGRHTYANSDAASLAKKIWPLLDQSIRDQIRGDVALFTGLEAQPWKWLDDGMTAVVVEGDEERLPFSKEGLPKGVGFGKPTPQEGGGSEGSDLTEGERSTLNDSQELTVEHADEGIRMTDAEFETFMRAAKNE